MKIKFADITKGSDGKWCLNITFKKPHGSSVYCFKNNVRGIIEMAYIILKIFTHCVEDTNE